MPLEFTHFVVDEDRRNRAPRHVARMTFAGTVNQVALDLTIVLTVPNPSDAAPAAGDRAGLRAEVGHLARGVSNSS